MTGPVDDGVEQRLHPLTPLALVLRVIWILVVVSLSELDHAGSQGSGSDNVIVTVVVVGSLAVLLLARGIVAVATTRYWVSGGELLVDSGLISKVHKRARLSRVQSIDVTTPLSARVLGLAELRVATAGTESSSIRLRYLSEPVARALRADLLGRTAGWGSGAAQAPEVPLVVVPHGTLVGSSILRSISWRLLPFMAGPVLTAVGTMSATNSSVVSRPGESAAVGTGIALSVTFLIYFGHSIFRRVSTLWDFTVAESPDGLRIRHGLLSTSSQTVPFGRIQAVRIHQPFFWRPFGWVTVQMNVAGYAGKREAQNTTLLPVGPRDFAQWLVSRVLGDDVGAVPLSAPPARAAWRAPIWWRHQGVGTDGRVLVARHGLFSRSVEYVPHERTQSVALSAGPWQRRLGLATLELDSTRGPVKIRCRFRDQLEARRMLDEQADRARWARAVAARPAPAPVPPPAMAAAGAPAAQTTWPPDPPPAMPAPLLPPPPSSPTPALPPPPPMPPPAAHPPAAHPPTG